jgi:hypothetical protein
MLAFEVLQYIVYNRDTVDDDDFYIDDYFVFVFDDFYYHID